MFLSKRFKFTFSLISVIYILLGLFLAISPGTARQVLSYLLGGLALLLGIILVAFYFVKGDNEAISTGGLAGGVVLLCLGFYLFARPSLLWQFLPVLVGFFILYDSVIKLQNAIKLKGVGLKFWWAALALSILSGVFALLLIIFGLDIVLLYFGIILIASGVVNLAILVLLFFAEHTIKKQQKKTATMIELDDVEDVEDVTE